MTARTRRHALIGGLLILAAVLIGCMSFTVGERHEIVSGENDLPPNACSGDLLEQVGNVRVADHAEVDVYYPYPYISPPNLALEGDSDHCFIVQQRRDRFRVKNTGLFDRDVRWRARGLKLVLAPPVVVPASGPPPEARPVRQVPPEPVPVFPQK
jgi:hypothetical protein